MEVKVLFQKTNNKRRKSLILIYKPSTDDVYCIDEHLIYLKKTLTSNIVGHLFKTNPYRSSRFREEWVLRKLFDYDNQKTFEI